MVCEAGSQPVAHLAQAFVKGAGEMGLGTLGLLGETAKRAGHFGQTVFEIGGAAQGLDRIAAARTRRPPGEDNGGDQQDEGKDAPGQHDVEESDGRIADAQDDLLAVHGGKSRPIRPEKEWPVHTGINWYGRALDPHDSGRRQEPFGPNRFTGKDDRKSVSPLGWCSASAASDPPLDRLQG
ncbi:MAG: hypothetical protein HY245_07925 [Rhizobiales bacterium]|nr:hypothetical protein [Hyphomicrobiales bacterium]